MMLVCQFCGQEFERPKERGPAPKFCKPSHRQRAYQLRALERFRQQVLAEGQDSQ